MEQKSAQRNYLNEIILTRLDIANQILQYLSRVFFLLFRHPLCLSIMKWQKDSGQFWGLDQDSGALIAGAIRRAGTV